MLQPVLNCKQKRKQNIGGTMEDNKPFWEQNKMSKEMQATEALVKLKSQFEQYKTYVRKLENISEASQTLAEKNERASDAALTIIRRIKEIIADVDKPIEERYKDIAILMAGITC